MKVPTPSLKAIGTINPICPYCQNALKKKPGSKTKCPHCGNPIYVRTRPLDGQKILVTELQLDDVEEQNAIKNGVYPEYLERRREIETIKQKLTQQSGFTPSKSNLMIAVLRNDADKHEKNGDWGLFTTALSEMAAYLWKEKRFQEAFEAFLLVGYLDINGPVNTGGYAYDSRMLKLSPPFREKLGFLSSGLVFRLIDAMRELGIGLPEVEMQFLEKTGKFSARVSLPVTAPRAWDKIKNEIVKRKCEN